jgi:F0F1-type ATP synthase membrane subunit b/b'
MRRSGYIFFLAALFLAVAAGLHAADFWKVAGLPVPHGYVAQGLLFLALLFLLQNTLFDPYLTVLEERERQTTGKRGMAERTLQDAEGMLTRYRRTISEAEREAVKERESRALAAEEEERRLLAETKRRANDDFRRTMEEVRGEADRAKSELGGSISPLAADIVRKVLRS